MISKQRTIDILTIEERRARKIPPRILHGHMLSKRSLLPISLSLLLLNNTRPPKEEAHVIRSQPHFLLDSIIFPSPLNLDSLDRRKVTCTVPLSLLSFIQWSIYTSSHSLFCSRNQDKQIRRHLLDILPPYSFEPHQRGRTHTSTSINQKALVFESLATLNKNRKTQILRCHQESQHMNLHRQW